MKLISQTLSLSLLTITLSAVSVPKSHAASSASPQALVVVDKLITATQLQTEATSANLTSTESQVVLVAGSGSIVDALIDIIQVILRSPPFTW